MIKHILANYSKGIIIGMGCIIPGVSGGTVAIALNAFEDILEATANIHKHIKKSLIILLPIALGAICGLIVLSTPLEKFCDTFPQASKYIFCIIALFSCMIFVKRSLKGEFTNRKTICLLFGVISALAITSLTQLFEFDFIRVNYISLFILGFPLALALVLPAISFSYMLLFLGIYEETLSAISNIDIAFLIPLSLGIVLGSYIFAKLLLKAVNNHSQETYSFVLGFVLCSIVDILI